MKAARLAAAKRRLCRSRSRSRTGSRDAQLRDHERRQGETRDCQQRNALRRHPAPLRAEGQGHEQTYEEQAEQDRPESIGARRLPADRIPPRQQEPTPEERDGPDRQIHEEDPAPAETAGKEPSERRTDAQPEIDGHHIDAESATALVRREHGSDDRRRCRTEQRRSGALYDATADHPAGVHAQ